MGFYLAAWDDGVFDGRVLGWIPNIQIRSIVLYFITWILWVLLFGCFVLSGFKSFDLTRASALVACAQWAVIEQFTFGVGQFREAVEASKSAAFVLWQNGVRRVGRDMRLICCAQWCTVYSAGKKT